MVSVALKCAQILFALSGRLRSKHAMVRGWPSQHHTQSKGLARASATLRLIYLRQHNSRFFSSRELPMLYDIVTATGTADSTAEVT